MSPFSLLQLTMLSIVLVLDQPSDAAPSAMLYLPQGDVREGDQRAKLSCVIDDAPDDYEAVFIRAKPSGTMEIIFMNGRVHHSEKFSVSKRGEHYYSLTLWNVSRTDTGKYACKIAVPTGATSTSFVASATANLDVFYLPVRPHCSNLNGHSKLQRLPGDASRLQCASQSGNPTVNLGWMQNGKPLGNLNARVSNPASNAGLVISQLDITHLEGDNGALFTCVLTSSGFPSFSRNCSIGPFILPTVGPTVSAPPPSLTHQGIVRHISIPTNSSVDESIGPDSTNIMDILGLPIVVGVSAAVALLLILLIIAIIVVKRRQQNRNTDFKHRESQSHLIGINGNNVQDFRRDSNHSNTIQHVVSPNGGAQHVMSPNGGAQHVMSPNGGALYAIVQKGKPTTNQCDDSASSDVEAATKLKTVPMMPAAKPAKSYPPPPAYPTQTERSNLNKTIDKDNANPAYELCNPRKNNTHSSPASLKKTLPSKKDNMMKESSAPSTVHHEYATLCEVTPSPDRDSPLAFAAASAGSTPLPRTEISNSTGLYKTVKLF